MRKLLTTVAKRIRHLLPATKEANDSDEKNASIWCVAANVADKIPSVAVKTETQRGTKHFRSGALVYCSTSLWGDGYENIKVVARHRGSNRYVTMVMRSAQLTNWRPKLVYSPHVIQEFQKMGASWDGSSKSKKLAEQLASSMAKQT
jgi:hypothetical protein